MATWRRGVDMRAELAGIAIGDKAAFSLVDAGSREE